ncbi:MAG: hypothetical protein LC777_07240, partial [Actinobacteria bacterium]|nr:hypothetical protein [Actinomycetota bacterium]
MSQERYIQVLTQRVREDRYPSRDLLDRLEENVSSEQLADYVALLVDKMHETRYPSKDIMDRIERLALEKWRKRCAELEEKIAPLEEWRK